MNGIYLTMSDVYNESMDVVNSIKPSNYRNAVWYYNSNSGICNHTLKSNDNLYFRCRTIIDLKKIE